MGKIIIRKITTHKMKRKNLSILLAAALVAVACSDNSENPSVEPTPGVDVQFGATLGQSDLDTRTYYGDETRLTDGGSVFPILWNSGDQVRIISPDCEENFQDRTYQVDADHEGKDYAETLQKTTDTGLRWGTESQASFCSIYPASGVTSVDIANKTFTLTMPSAQTDAVKNAKGTEAVTTTYTCAPQMDGCFMYAYTPNVVASQTVDLRYKPLSTAIRFTLTGPSNSAQRVYIQRVTLHSDDTYLAGTFTVDFSKCSKSTDFPSVTISESDASHDVELTPIVENTTNAFLSLASGESVELSAFIIPQEVTVGSGWHIEVQYNNGDKYKLSLDGTAIDGKTMTLKKGQIHRLPTLPALKEQSAWNPASWMTNIARNVYLSELSIPGSWNTLNTDCQGTDDTDTSIDAQWNLGCRAFHFDTRWRCTSSDMVIPSWITPEIDALSVADAGNTTTYTTNGPKMMRSGNATFVARLAEVTSHVSRNTGEYAVVLCSFAQGSYPKESDNNKGRTPSSGDMSGKTWMQAISEACEDASVSNYIYDASKLTPETVVGDVLGKVIVIVCCDYDLSELTLPTSSKCLFTYSPQSASKSDYQADYHDSELYYASKASSGVSFRSSKAQITATDDSDLDDDELGFEDHGDDERGYAPTLATRKTQLGNILTWSKGNFAKSDYDHAHWAFLGLGGYMYKETTYWLFGTQYSHPDVDGAYTTVASTLNEFIKDKVEAMDTDKNYYPVGLVLMNFVSDYSTLVSEIYQLNTKYEMSHDETKSPTDGTSLSDSGVKARTQPAYKRGGNAISH